MTLFSLGRALLCAAASLVAGAAGAEPATPAKLLPAPSQIVFVTKQMAKKLESLDIPPIPEFIQLIADSGAKLYACKASVDMFGLKQEDFVDTLEGILTVGEFYEKAAGGQIIFT